MNTDYRQYVAQCVKSDSRQIARKWLARLEPVVQEELRDIFPTEEYLDHIPMMVEEIGTIVGSGDSELAMVNSVISRKALQLGSLRHQQKASISQLLREYDILATILDEHLGTATQHYGGDVSVGDALAISNVINSVIRQILQYTVDAFAERYMATIDEQTERLASFNNLVGHEIRTPLNSALLGLEWVCETTDLDATAMEEMQRIRKGMLQAASVVEDIENLVTVESATLRDDPVVQTIEISPLMEDLETQLTESMTARGVELKVAQDLGAITVEAGKLKLILTNLLSNAIKYSDSAKSTRYIQVERVDLDDQCVEIRVSDNGLGIPRDKQSDVFKLRVRVHAELDNQHDVTGHGLGLYLVNEAVRELGGRVILESEEGVGTVVRVQLPGAAASQAT